MKQRIPFALLMVGLALLSGCSSDEDSELRSWMAHQRATIKPKITPIEEPKQFIPAAYNIDSAQDPFEAMRLTQALKRDSNTSSVNSGLITPELARRKEPLEAHPLDAIHMVGSMNKNGVPIALIRVDKLIYQVRVGNHLGQNYGLVTKISETNVQLREIVQDTTGDWIERQATLDLQEGPEGKK
ncbi:pilus assembly protein PilP [Diaphorobacter aerolatus]|uniref:Pilus assembly protein PilP n=1 Tax=Diaphorobacter aerolatus TaxID=1288495 RepID=A0A7H0GNI1_9BURK|nr:pilus assembly protein PilP [Diaphorobacter aerolatus]QNP49847.1 pilus assembly protein PilP [Diaphorobacter aerolatus]